MEIKNRTLSNFAELVRTGECKKFRGRLKVGVDLGTANTVIFQNDKIVLDEPSIGLHQRDNDKLLDTILEQFSNSEKKTCFLKTDGLVHYPSDNRAFTGGTVICACKKVKGFGRCILPRKATGIDEENLSLLCDGLCKLVMYYNPQNT